MIFAWWHVVVAALPLLPTFWSIWHIWTHAFDGEMNRKMMWLVLVVFLPVLGGLIYIAAGRKKAGKRL